MEAPLFFAARKLSYRALELLLENGATNDALNRSNESAFAYLIRYNKVDKVFISKRG